MSDTQSKPRIEDEPAAWFAMLMTARERDDFDLAAKADQKLKQLGVTVKFKRTPRPATAGGPTRG